MTPNRITPFRIIAELACALSFVAMAVLLMRQSEWTAAALFFIAAVMVVK